MQVKQISRVESSKFSENGKLLVLGDQGRKLRVAVRHAVELG